MTALCGSEKLWTARRGPGLCRGGADSAMMPRPVKLVPFLAMSPRRSCFSGCTPPPLKGPFRTALVSKAAGPGKGPSPHHGEDGNKEGPVEGKEDAWKTGLLEFAVRTGGVGTAAVALGFFLDIDPFANIHWSIPDIAIGMWCVAPLLIYNSVVMLWGGNQEKSIGNLIVERVDPLASESERQPMPMLGPVEERSEMQTLMSALQQYQQQAAVDNPLREVNPIVEAGIIVVVSLSAEMFYRAVLLTVSGSWIRDRLYEGGAEDLLWGTGVPTDDAGLWFATFLFASFGIRGLIVRWRAVASFRSSMSEKFRKYPGGAVQGAAAKALRRASEVTKVATVIDAVDSVMNEVAMCSALILTGNLAAPFTAQVARQVLYSAHQRINYHRMAKYNVELQDRLQGHAQELKLRLLKASVDKQLAHSSAPDEEERNTEAGSSDGQPDEKATTSDSQPGAEVSVDLGVLLTVLRMEASRTGVMIKEETQRNDDPDRLKTLNSQKDELSVLVNRVEHAMAEREKDEASQESVK